MTDSPQPGLEDEGWHRFTIPPGVCYLYTDPYERDDRVRLIAVTSQYFGGCSMVEVRYADTDWSIDEAVCVYAQTDCGRANAWHRAEAVAWELGSGLGSLFAYQFNPEYREACDA